MLHVKMNELFSPAGLASHVLYFRYSLLVLSVDSQHRAILISIADFFLINPYNKFI